MQVHTLLRALAVAACAAACTIPESGYHEPLCGNGEVEAGEECDPGALVTDQCAYGEQSCMRCTATCQLVAGVTSYCGDSHVDPLMEACDDGNHESWDGCDSDCTATVGSYLKASNPDASNQFGYAVALSADGSTLAVAAPFERSAATGVGGNQGNKSASNAGAVYVFVREGKRWVQQAYLKAANTDANDQFGVSLALSADGSTLAVGAHQESSAATGIGGDQTSNSMTYSGAVYVFTRDSAGWRQQAYVKASNTYVVSYFGFAVALSADGSTLAVGAYGERSASTGVNGPQSNNGYTNSGAVYIFRRTATGWGQQAYIKASNTYPYDYFGYSVALSADGATLAVGAPGEDSNATGINGNQGDYYYGFDGGAVYVFTYDGTAWSQQAYVKASNTDASDNFGTRVALSGDGLTLAVGAYLESSNAFGIDGDQANNSATNSGAVYMFVHNGAVWRQQAYVKASNPGTSDQFGLSLALSTDGDTLAVGAPLEDGAAVGIDGPVNDSALDTGAVYVFARHIATWTQRAYVKASNTGANDRFGSAIALSGDGAILVASASNEASGAWGVDGNQSDNSAPGAGAVYVYH